MDILEYYYQRENIELYEENEDEDFVELIEQVAFPRSPRIFRERQDYFTWPDTKFKERFRLSKQVVRFLIEEIEGDIGHLTNRNHAVSPQESVLITLRFLATGSFLQVVGDFGGIDTSTTSRLVSKVLRSIASLHKAFINMPTTPEQCQTLKQEFYEEARFPNCIGALDCTHIKIQSPGGNNAEIFRNRKQFFSYNVQSICTAKFKIQNLVCRWPGSSHDSTIFNNSRVKREMENNVYGPGSLLLGDDGGYAIKDYLLTPLRNPVNRAENLYNSSHKMTRNVIERCFGILKRRFPVLALGIRLHHTKVEALVVAASVVLHNIACQYGEVEDEFPLNEEVEAAINFARDINPHVEERNRINQDNVVRHNLIHNYFQNLL